MYVFVCPLVRYTCGPCVSNLTRNCHHHQTLYVPNYDFILRFGGPLTGTLTVYH